MRYNPSGRSSGAFASFNLSDHATHLPSLYVQLYRGPISHENWLWASGAVSVGDQSGLFLRISTCHSGATLRTPGIYARVESEITFLGDIHRLHHR